MFKKARIIPLFFSFVALLAALFVSVPTSEAQSNTARVMADKGDIIVIADRPIQTINLFHSENWSNTATLQRDFCGGAAQGATFPVTLTFDLSDKLVSLAWFNTMFTMTPDSGGYVGSTQVGDATCALRLSFNQPSGYTSYTGYVRATFPKPGGYDCVWMFYWQGTKQ